MQPEIQRLLAVWVVAYGKLQPSIRVRPAGRSWMTGFQTYASLVFARIRHRSLQCIYARERLTITAMPYRAMVCSRAQMEVLRGHNLPTQLLLTFAAESSVMLQAMYLCTGEANYNSDAVQGDGVFKSTNGGTTWTQLANTTSFDFCSRIVCDASGNVFMHGRG